MIKRYLLDWCSSSVVLLITSCSRLSQMGRVNLEPHPEVLVSTHLGALYGRILQWSCPVKLSQHSCSGNAPNVRSLRGSHLSCQVQHVCVSVVEGKQQP